MEHGHDLEGPVPRYAVLLRGEQMTVTVTWAAAPVTVDGKPAHTAFPTYPESQSGLKFKKKTKNNSVDRQEGEQRRDSRDEIEVPK